MPAQPHDPHRDDDDEADEEEARAFGADDADGVDDEEEEEDDEEDDDDADDADGEDADGQRPAVFITTSQPVEIRVDRIDDERAPEGSVLGAYIGGRLVARSAMPAEAIERLLALGLFDTPVPLGLFAYEEEPGLQCRLFALVPSSALSESSHADEPWKASVPSYEERVAQQDDDDDDEDGPTLETILLGHIVRFAADRKHPDDLAAEAVDVLHKILTGGPMADANAKAIDDLLNNL
jgi:hypothetical protein